MIRPEIRRQLRVVTQRHAARQPRWRGWSAEITDLGNGVLAQAWYRAGQGQTCYATTDGEFFYVGDGESPAQAYERMLRWRERCACLSYTDLADLEDDEAGQTHVTTENNIHQESR